MILARLDERGEIAEYPYLRLHADHPGTSFPIPLEGADLSDFGAVWIAENPAPQVETGEVSETLPVRDKNGVWTQNWTVTA